jgi:hypothetical protein
LTNPTLRLGNRPEPKNSATSVGRRVHVGAGREKSYHAAQIVMVVVGSDDCADRLT